MKRSLYKLISELKKRAIDQPVTRAEVDALIEALEAQEKAAKIESLRARLKVLTA